MKIILKTFFASSFVIFFLVFGNFANAQTVNQGYAISAYQMPPLFQIKEYRAPGVICILKRALYVPDLFSLSSQMKEMLTVELIKKCEKEITKKTWKSYATPTTSPASSLRQMNTEGMFCQKVIPVGSPVLYTVSMFSLDLTQKQPEINECLELLEKSPDKMQQYLEKQMDRDV